MTCCDVCHKELIVGEFPFCPHGMRGGHMGIIGDECDVVQENGFHHPTRFTSKSALAKALDEKGLEMRVRHVPIPGSDKSPHTTDWSKGSIDPQTLANVTELVSRNGRSSGKDTTLAPAPIGTWTMTVRES